MVTDRLNSNEDLTVTGSIISADGRYTLVMQRDGNLVLHQLGGQPLWATKTHGKTVSEAIMQDDGNFVLYGPGRAVVWQTATNGHPGAWLAVQNDGNVVVYDPAGYPLWDTKTNIPKFGSFPLSREDVLIGVALRGEDKGKNQDLRKQVTILKRSIIACLVLGILVIAVILLWSNGSLDQDNRKFQAIIALILFCLTAEKFVLVPDLTRSFNWLTASILIPLLIFLLTR